MTSSDMDKVLSLFDGMSCGQIALNRLGVEYDKYFASEIDKYAIKITQKNYPETVQVGDITALSADDLPDIDLVIGGSPCQGFSFAGKQLNFDDPRSKMFFEYVRMLNECNPEYFLLENVKMKQEYQDVITDYLGVPPVEIDSALVSAQRRKRLYWTNIPGYKTNLFGEKLIGQPEDKGILLKDIVHENTFTLHDKPYCLKKYIVPFDKTLKILNKEVEEGKVGYFRKDSQANRVYFIHNKAVTLCGGAGGGAGKMGQYLFGCITPDRIEKRQNGQRFNDGNKFYTLTEQDRRGVLIEGYIRKLTPVECERLQTVPDDYTEGVSDTQRYKMLGNGFTVDVICHLLKRLKDE